MQPRNIALDPAFAKPSVCTVERHRRVRQCPRVFCGLQPKECICYCPKCDGHLKGRKRCSKSGCDFGSLRSAEVSSAEESQPPLRKIRKCPRVFCGLEPTECICYCPKCDGHLKSRKRCSKLGCDFGSLRSAEVSSAEEFTSPSQRSFVCRSNSSPDTAGGLYWASEKPL